MLRTFLIIAGLVGIMCGGVYLYYRDTQDRLAALQQQTATLKDANDAKQKTIDTLESDALIIKQNQDHLNDMLATAREQADKTKAEIAKHDLEAIGAAHPQMLEDRVNAATKKTLKTFEDTTRRGQ